jgi:hypothetical protein
MPLDGDIFGEGRAFCCVLRCKPVANRLPVNRLVNVDSGIVVAVFCNAPCPAVA